MHISNIFSTFAADLGIVPSAIVNKFFNMKKECIFKVFAGGYWWYVYGVPASDLSKTVLYRVYCGRKRYGIWTFESQRVAIELCVAAALGCVVSISGEVKL